MTSRHIDSVIAAIVAAGIVLCGLFLILLLPVALVKLAGWLVSLAGKPLGHLVSNYTMIPASAIAVVVGIVIGFMYFYDEEE